MMQNLFRWWQFVLIGMGIATVFWCCVIFVLGVWAGWPRARERELEHENDELNEFIDRLMAKGETDHGRREGTDNEKSTGSASLGTGDEVGDD